MSPRAPNRPRGLASFPEPSQPVRPRPYRIPLCYAGLSQRAAAEAIGVSRDVLLRAESGEGIRPRHAKLIADFYGVLVTDIWPVEREAA